jgi:hypothetical protein
MLTKYAKKVIKNFNYDDIVYIEELLDDSSDDYHNWHLYVVVKNVLCHYNWKYIFGIEQTKGYNNEYETIQLKDINNSNREDFIDILKKIQLNI